MLKIFPDTESLNNFAAEKFVQIANSAIEEKGWFAVALSGGSTPKGLYQLLASEKFKDKIDWTKVYFWFGDERFVPPDDQRSNFRMANEALFDPLRISPENIFRWKTELENAAEAAGDYEKKIVEFFKPLPRFDLILLGMGADGHTASLFPFTKGVDSSVIACANKIEKSNETRLTLTFPVINTAANIIFLIAGEEKAEALREVLEGEFNPEKFPAQNVKPVNGNLLWLADSKAARLLQ